ncbi:hypothetical protein [Rhizobium sp. FY34]|uniref:hypothetical protein n=1 Tax=Rhizobium sp. FY34 TaxID=2562309 RepID=UPI0010C0B9E4|nr:hypothetical protein [Rhizobium sp. FY34]
MPDRFRCTSLQSILVLDAATCAIMGALLVFTSGFIASITLVPAGVLFWAGLLLLPIAGFIGYLARTPIVPTWAVQMIVLGNALWVLVSVALPMLELIFPNGFGWIFILSQAMVVAIFGSLEWFAPRCGGLIDF